MENGEIKEMMKSDPEGLIDILEQRVRHIDFLEDPKRNDILDYIAAKVSGLVSPYLRLARQVRRGTYPRWVEFQKVLEELKLTETLTRVNDYQPIPEYILNHGDSCLVADLERHIEFFNELHAREDRNHEQIFVGVFNTWAKPALLYAFEKVDVGKSDREIVTYICKAFNTKFIAKRAESQGMARRRVNGKWVYYHQREVNDFDFTNNDVMECIFQTTGDFPDLAEMAPLLTKSQTKILINLNNIVRDDVSQLTQQEFYTKYPHKRMNYRQTSEAIGVSYESFVKNIQRIKARLGK